MGIEGVAGEANTVEPKVREAERNKEEVKAVEVEEVEQAVRDLPEGKGEKVDTEA